MNKFQNSFNFLRQVGLGDTEIRTYISLLSGGESLVMDISKRTGLHRPTIYKALKNLNDKGLVKNASKGKRLTYIAESPDHLEILFKNIQRGVNGCIAPSIATNGLVDPSCGISGKKHASLGIKVAAGNF